MSNSNINIGPFSGDARWIWGEGGLWQKKANVRSPYRVCYFRKFFYVPENGAKLTVHVSADSRYILYVNGSRVSTGPAKGDIEHQFYDTVVFDPYLRSGRNIIGAVVISYAPTYLNYSGLGGPNSIMTAVPAFILDGVLTSFDGQIVIDNINTNNSWSTFIDRAYGHHEGPNGIISGLGEDIKYSEYPEGWQNGEDMGIKWLPAVELALGVTRDTVQDSPLPFRLTPRLIPFMSEQISRFTGVYSVKGVSKNNVLSCILYDTALCIPPNTNTQIILYTDDLTTAYPVIGFTGGKGSGIRITYSEALYKGNKKSSQPVLKGGDVHGIYDRIIPDGRNHVYQPLHWRTFRYVKIDVNTSSDAIFISRMRYVFTAYPLDSKAEFNCSDPDYKKIWDITFHTLKLCCHETYEDCPYYEQLQYAGDSQVVSLVAGYMTGDWRLTRQAILQFYWSIGYEGIPKSRYPSRIPQIIPSWALLWVVMVYEYWWHTGDLCTAAECIGGVKSTIQWFKGFLNKDYLLEDLPYWKVVDWVKEWDSPNGCPPGAHGGVTGVISCQYAYCLKIVSHLLAVLGEQRLAKEYMDVYTNIINGINSGCWDEDKGLYKDSPDFDTYSELGNAWAILCGCADQKKAMGICNQMNENSILARSTLYGRYYIFRALEKCGRYDKFPDMLDWWHVMLNSDLTTWPEEPWLARSFCHAWSCSPGYEFLSQILGVKPKKPGFQEVLIEPQPCGLKWAKGKVPILGGMVEIEWSIVGNEMHMVLSMPNGIKYTVRSPENYKIVLK